MAQKLLSPGVKIVENDYTTVVPNTATSIGGFAGQFNWGPVNQITTISNENELVSTFGKPGSNYIDFFSCSNFLSYSRNLKVNRADTKSENTTTTQEAAYVGGTQFTINNYEVFETTENSEYSTVGIIARYPGSAGNSLKVVIVDANTDLTATPYDTYAANLSYKSLGTSDYAVSVGSSVIKDEISVLVYDEDGYFTGNKGQLIEKFELLSKLPTAKNLANNTSIYFVDYINTNSQYIYLGGVFDYATLEWDSETSYSTGDFVIYNNNLYISEADTNTNIPDSEASDWVIFEVEDWDSETSYSTGDYVIHNNILYISTADTNSTTPGEEASDWTIQTILDDIITVADINGNSIFPLSGGTDLINVDVDYETAYELFGEYENEDNVDLYITGNYNITTIGNIISMVEQDSMKNGIVFVSPDKDSVVGTDTQSVKTDNIKDDFTTINSSYVVADSGWKYQYDKYNNVYRWLPLNPDIAGICARTDYNEGVWTSPAGPTKGQIKNCIKLAFNPNNTSRDALYIDGINSVISKAGEGTFLYGDKTMLSKPSAFDRINVRRLFILVEKAIKIASEYILFELNDDFTRNSFVNMVDPFLREIQGQRGIVNFRTICDESNNPSQIIQNNEFVADILIQPNYSINFITLNFNAVGNSLTFNEIAGA